MFALLKPEPVRKPYKNISGADRTITELLFSRVMFEQWWRGMKKELSIMSTDTGLERVWKSSPLIRREIVASKQKV